MRELHRSMVELFDDDRRAEAAASYEIAKSAQRFSHNAKEVVDDKLSFSATLMRAGEVQAANRLLAEVERQVRDEEAALIETVNEVKVAQSLRRERVTRLRLAKLIAVATVGSALLTFSAAGMAVAGFLRDRAASTSRPDQGVKVASKKKARSDRSVSEAITPRRSLRRLRIGDVRLVLTKAQFERLQVLTGGSLDSDGLEDILGVLPAPLADRIQQAITIAGDQVDEKQADLEQIAAAPVGSVDKKKRAAKRAAAETQEEQEATADEKPSPEPTEADDQGQPPSNEDESEDEGDEGEDSLPLHP